MFHIRAALPSDQEGLLELSQFLNSVNLPHDAETIAELLALSEQSFSERLGNPRKQEYLFVICENVTGRVVGTSMVIGQLGRRDAPYIYFDVDREERYSETLDRHFIHRMLTVRYSFNGPTEIGGLVVHPDYRRHPYRIGMLISYVRFLWIAMHRQLVQDEILAELMPPLCEDGSSYLWEAVGRRFTDLSYREADRLSKRNKEFIRNLFPRAGLYATLLSQEAQNVIGKVGPQTQGVEHLLRRIGFTYADRIDPFDGGPHFVAPTDKITLVRISKPLRLIGDRGSAHQQRALIGADHVGAPYFTAVASPCTLHSEDPLIAVPPEVAKQLQVEAGSNVWAMPLM
ncbi:MAG: arginine N-succinyltransferase [Myxococcales bacterium]|nr:arginine N-succinyltransferase [Myxococcales bacterium]MCB9707183.1 arginine N-succinyltransferase [Myxococcales bacterium]